MTENLFVVFLAYTATGITHLVIVDLMDTLRDNQSVEMLTT